MALSGLSYNILQVNLMGIVGYFYLQSDIS